MSDRVQNEFGIVKISQGGTGHIRPHLAVGPVPETAENAANAVAPTGASQKTAVDDLPSNEKALLDTIGQIRKESDVLARNAEQRKEVDAIMARLFNAQQRDSGSALMGMSRDPVDTIEADLQTLEEKFPGMVISEKTAGLPEKPQNAAERVAVVDRARVIAKIEAALKRVEKLRSEITTSDDQAYARLLNIGVTVSGLTVARNRVSEDIGSLSSASNTAENVMVNLRAIMLSSHSKISTDIVHLILP
jgi:hypothetical protein